MEYHYFTTEDFVLDEYFQRWVLEPDGQTHSFWDTWLLQHPEKKTEVQQARQLLLALKLKADYLEPARKQKIQNAILAAIQQEAPVRPLNVSSDVRPGTRNDSFLRRQHWMRLAATLVVGLLAVLGGLYWYANRKITYETDYGKTTSVTLPDGTKVTLNAHSQLQVRPEWNPGETRHVWLEGEAFFEVSKQKTASGATKFQVHTKDLTVEVLGTKFNVSKRNERTTVTLNEGKVKLALNVRNARQYVTMKPGEMVKFSENNQKIEKVSVKAENQSSWTKNYWILDHTRLSEIVQRIESEYGYEVSVTNPALLEESISGVLPTQNLSSLAEVLAATYNVKIQVQNNQLIITK